MAEHRVAITGMGIIAPLGIGAEPFWKALLEKKAGVAPLTRFDCSGFPTRIAAQVDDFDATAFLSRRRIQWTDRFSQLAVAAARLAIDDAHFSVNGESGSVGVYTGSALGGLAFAEDQIEVFRREGLRSVRPLLSISVFGGAAASNVAIEFGITGPTIANSDSCAAGAIAIGEAYRAVKRGDMRAALAGGIEAPLAPLTFGAFTVARAMSTRNEDPAAASRPFDAARDGFVMGEGAGMFVLERYADAVARDATIYAEITGFGTSNDAYHMSAPLADGAQTADAMQHALDEAQISPSEVEALNAHGSSTKLGDRAETLAYDRIFGDRLREIPVSATKGQHGHALGATGAWEIAISALSMRDGVIPGAINLERLDDCAIWCSRESHQAKTRVVLSNSSGFGGINAALVLLAADAA
ncbi:MAG TPA: beta-ketoacyl-[acyl-carrier-protein] synthase family protein [Candidatus Rubrimentiphilum sp.]|nr:beta-ketoacyl-[acyl-carrier-protein] synthase family protein [Candidatus Rubrimentiphilum sp.]